MAAPSQFHAHVCSRPRISSSRAWGVVLFFSGRANARRIFFGWLAHKFALLESSRSSGFQRGVMKFIFVTGGVVSSLGKGIATSCLGAILRARGYKVVAVKIDPYINLDAGTMRP